MVISIWYVRKDTGQVDNSVPKRQVKDVEEAIEMVRAHRRGADCQHILRVHSAARELSQSEHHRLVAAGAEILFP
jgi:hypothetical protein